MPAHAFSSGITGVSGKQGFTCNFCHAGGAQPAVAFDAPPAVEPGTTVTLAFEVQSAHPSQRAAGFNVAAETGGGALSIVPGQGTRLLGGELTQTAPRSNDANGVARWEFGWTAPLAPGRYTLFGSGNSVNLNGADTGDRSQSTTIAIDVAAAASVTPTQTATPSLATPTPTPTATPPPATSTPTQPATATATAPTTPTHTLPAGPTPTPTGTATGGATATPTPTGTISACPGDCDGDGQVAINELITAVSIALGALPIDACPAADRDGDGAVSVAELIAAVNAALSGC